MSKEVFKNIDGYDGLYSVSSEGYVISHRFNKDKILKGSIGNSGYKQISLFKNGVSKCFRIHNLIANTFIRHTPDRKHSVIDHINNIKTDNRLSNLQVVTNRYNSIKDKIPKSGHSCIYLNGKKYLVRLRVDGVKKSLGTFEKIEDAIRCRDAFLKDEFFFNIKK